VNGDYSLSFQPDDYGPSGIMIDGANYQLGGQPPPAKWLFLNPGEAVPGGL
jgi:hypothetical protein